VSTFHLSSLVFGAIRQVSSGKVLQESCGHETILDLSWTYLVSLHLVYQRQLQNFHPESVPDLSQVKNFHPRSGPDLSQVKNFHPRSGPDLSQVKNFHPRSGPDLSQVRNFHPRSGPDLSQVSRFLCLASAASGTVRVRSSRVKPNPLLLWGECVRV
jgi:hypothetical protein